MSEFFITTAYASSGHHGSGDVSMIAVLGLLMIFVVSGVRALVLYFRGPLPPPKPGEEPPVTHRRRRHH